MESLIHEVLLFRSTIFVEQMKAKLCQFGITKPAELLEWTAEALDDELKKDGELNPIARADVTSLRAAIDPTKKQRRQERSRSRSPRRGNRNEKRDDNGRKGSGKARNNRRENKRRRPGRKEQDKKEKPKLWEACERNDVTEARNLIEQGADVEETFEGWPPLLKAAEENATECIQLLLDSGAPVNAKNRKGRTALSFAAAPSRNNASGKSRRTATQAMKVLLFWGADVEIKDDRGLTALERARQEKRDDAIAILEKTEQRTTPSE